MSAIRAANVAMDVYGIIICLILILYLKVSNGRDGKLQRYFTMMCIYSIGLQLGDIPNWVCEGMGSAWNPFLLETSVFLFYTSAALLLLSFTKYMVEYLSPKVKVQKWYWRLGAGLGIIYILLCVASVFNGMFFSIGEGNVYQRGVYFWLSQLIPFLLYGINTLMVTNYRKYMNKKEIMFFMAYILIPVIAELIQIRFYGISLLTVAVTMALLLIFINIQLEREIITKNQEKELAEARIDIMLTQIQPHFLYNVLVVIRQLCDRNPELAKETITEFSYFLRSNMSALSCRGMIPFEQELTHVQNYLSLEKKRFGQRLRVEYDIRTMGFMLPPLSIQPLAENAVRHGVMKKEEGGTITIRSEKLGDEYVVTVRDDGAGMDACVVSNGKEHIGLKNVCSRIESMCSGTVDIHGGPGKGTVIVVRIPDNGKGR